MNKRLAVAGFALVLSLGFAYLAFVNVAGNVLAYKAPELALRIDPNNEFANAEQANSLVMGSNNETADQERSLFLVEKSLRQAPGISGSLRNYVLILEPDLPEDRAYRIMQLASRLSKRDIVSLLWLVENASLSDNVPDTLSYYDRALSVEPQLGKLMFPLLANGLSDQELRDPILALLSERPSWLSSFLAFLLTDDQAAENLVLLDRTLSARSDIMTPDYRIQAGNRLIALGDYEAAKTMLPDSIRLSGDISDFSYRSTDRAPYSWSLKSGATHISEITGASKLMVRQQSGRGAVLAERMIAPGGPLRFRASVSSEASDPDRMPVFEITCVGGAPSYVVHALAKTKNNMFEYRRDEPGCEFAGILIKSSSNFSGQPVEFTIERLFVEGGADQ